MDRIEIDKRVGLVVGILVILMFFNSLIGFIGYSFLANVLDFRDLGEFAIREYFVSMGLFLLRILGNIVVAFWLNSEAKRLNRNRLIWTIFPLFFGLSAAFLFYLIEIYNEIMFLRKDMKRLIQR
jgi:hypothetical protein